MKTMPIPVPAPPDHRRARRTPAVLRGAALAACFVLGGCSGDPDPEVPVIQAQPSPQSARVGTDVTFSVTASGIGLSFRWQRSVDAGLSWADILGATAAQYTVAAPTLAMNGHQYRAIVTGSGGESVTTTPVTLSVTPAVRAVGEVFRDCSDACPELVVMPSGSFQMGVRAATDVFRDQSSPVHTVTIGYTLAVGRTEVTTAEFARFVQATTYVTDAERGAGCLVSGASAPVVRTDGNWRTPGFAQTDTDPVVCVSWNDAQAYVAWLNTVAPATNFRLLTEAEWEFVARAGATTTRYPWGDDTTYALICGHANSGDLTATATVPRFAGTRWTDCADGHGYTAPGDAFPASAFGLRNVIGNAWEWVQDGWHANYSGAPTDGSAWPVTNGDTSRIYRGGSWNNHPTYLDPAYRARGAPTYSEEGLGFRVARAL